MKTLQIDEKKAKGLYENASPEYRAILEDTFGKDFFVSIQERVKSYEDACLELGLNPYDLPKVDNCEHEDRASIIAFYKLTIIARALNEGWKPNWQDSDERKYYPWFNVTNPAGFVYSSYNYATTSAHAAIGSRLCLKTHELATYFGKQFEKLWAEYLLF